MRILVIVPPERFDFYNYLAKLESHELILLWHVSEKDMKFSLKELPVKFSDIIFWCQFHTPKQLLTQIKPDKIVFFEIVDLRQIALIVTSKKFNITTFYLEHGAAGDKDTSIKRWSEQNFNDHKLPYLLNRFKNNFKDVISSKYFYFSVTTGFESIASYLKYFKLPFLILRDLGNKVLAHNKFKERIPSYSIVFNRINFDPLELYTGISEHEALFTGVPQFDKYFSNQNVEENYLIYIDHPYLEQGILDWTIEHHRKIAEQLISFAEERKMKLYIKLHPISKMENWNKYTYNPNYVEIIQFGEFTNLYLKSKLILGFSSSLLTGFLCAKKNVVLLGWHPIPHIFGMDFTKTGLCHTSLDPQDIHTQYNSWINDNKCNRQEKYESFLKECNFPFDGNATERVLHAITTL